MWVTELKDLPSKDTDSIPGSVRRRAQYTRDVVEAATSRDADLRWTTAVRCIARKRRRACTGRIVVLFDGAREEVEWECDTCGERGVIRGFSCCEHDMSDFLPCADVVSWWLDDEARGVLWEATQYHPDLRAVIARATTHVEHPEVLVVEAMVAELDDVYTLVEHLTDGTRSRRRRDLLDGLRASLCCAMDDF